jgi:hypothetical protein
LTLLPALLIIATLTVSPNIKNSPFHAVPAAHIAHVAQHATKHHRNKHHKIHRRAPKIRYTGFVVEGRVSTFGYLTGDSEGQTADGGNTTRPCIAIRNDSTLDHWFEVTIDGHHAKLLQCDWGPSESTGRSIDVTGMGDEALGFSPGAFPTESYGVAKEIA